MVIFGPKMKFFIVNSNFEFIIKKIVFGPKMNFHKKMIFSYEFLKFMSCILFNVMTRVGSDQHNGIIDD